jgi:hypothetical protein
MCVVLMKYRHSLLLAIGLLCSRDVVPRTSMCYVEEALQRIGYVCVDDNVMGLYKKANGTITNVGEGDVIEALLYSPFSEREISGSVFNLNFRARALYDDNGTLTSIVGEGCIINARYIRGSVLFEGDVCWLPVGAICDPMNKEVVADFLGYNISLAE